MASSPATRPYHHGNLRVALLARAVEVVDERGAADLSLRELARDGGGSHAAPRRHFADRGALLDALGVVGFDGVGVYVRAAVDRAGSAFDARLEQLARAYLAFATHHAALLELMWAAKRRHESDALHAAANHSLATMLGVIADAQASGELAPGDRERVAIPIFATLQGLTAMANGGMLDAEQVGEALTVAIEQLLDGLRPR